MIYAYVTSETCRNRNAVRPGTEIDGRPVSKRGDYIPWPYGKRETLAIATGHGIWSSYMQQSAAAIARLLGWDRP